jgi:serine/threonine protein kinase
MGEVYLAEDLILRRRVAIKFLSSKLNEDEHAKRRLLREARAAAKLDHANICSIYEVGEEGGRSFIVMQYVEGETLACKNLAKHLSVHDSLSIAIQVTDALADAHSHGIIHRDLKPENIIVGPRGQVKVLDFGLAKALEENRMNTDSQTESLLSEAGVIIGTVPYMSPEQVRAEKVDARSDIFSIGTILYEMISGKQPFLSGSKAQSIAAVLTTDPLPLNIYARNIPAGLDRIVRKCLDKDKEQRYQSAHDLLGDLKTMEEDIYSAATLKESASGYSLGVGTHRLAARQWLVATLLAAVVVITVAGLYFRGLNDAGSTKPTAKPISSIAVLPFANDSGDPEIDYLSDGLTESLMNNLSQLPSMKVTASTSVFHYKGQDIDPRSVGHSLNVQALLLGRVIQHRDDLSISIELVDVETNSRLWGEQYHRRLSDLVSIQGEMSKDITNKLRPKLSGEQTKQATKGYPDNTEAYQLYLKGRYYWNKRTVESLAKASDYFQQAIQKDPSYALAYVGLADAYLVSSVLPGKEASAKANEAALKALAIDSSLAEAHASLGFARSRYDWNWPEAEKEYQRAIELNPNYSVAYYWYADLLMVLGRLEEALTQLKRAQALDPLSPTINAAMERDVFYQRQYDRAIEQMRKSVELEPNFWSAHFGLGLAYTEKKMYADAIKELQAATTISGNSPTPLAMLGYAYAVSGKRDRARQVMTQLNELAKHRHVSPYDLAVIYVGLGDKNQAFKWLDKAYEEHDPSLALLKIAPWLDSLRSDSRFSALIRRVGFPG